jgi:hypothetical protein
VGRPRKADPEKLIRDLRRRKRAFEKYFKKRREEGKLFKRNIEIAYTRLCETIIECEEMLKEYRERMRLMALPRDELIREIYGDGRGPFSMKSNGGEQS